MSLNNDRDARAVLTREKYFSLRPKPLERWLWQQGVPQSAERVYWLHWEEGMRSGDWCSELALKQVARECALDKSTVTRAYQCLRRLGLIRREDPGRDPNDPFRQAIAITEVLVPRELLVSLSRYPNRRHDTAHAEIPPMAINHPPPESVAVRGPTEEARLDRTEMKALLNKLSARERSEYFTASRDRRTAMPFDEGTILTPEERGKILALLTRVSSASPAATNAVAPLATRTKPVYASLRKLSPLEAARVRASVLQVAPASEGAEVFRQVLWSMEEGALRRFEPRMALNVALKKIREGEWTRPNRLPPNWLAIARPESCSAA